MSVQPTNTVSNLEENKPQSKGSKYRFVCLFVILWIVKVKRESNGIET